MNSYSHIINIYQDEKNEWRWRLLAENGKIVADSAEGYSSKDNVHRAIDALPLIRTLVTVTLKDANARKSSPISVP